MKSQRRLPTQVGLIAFSHKLCRLQDYAAWRSGTSEFPRKLRDSMIADAA